MKKIDKNQTKEKKEIKNNPMREIFISKITVNCGVGEAGPLLEKAKKMIKIITEKTVVETVTKKRILQFNIRPGLSIGTKVTLRKNTEEFLMRMLKAKENKLEKSNFDDRGNFSFGIKEYIDIPDMDYDPEIGIMGFNVCVTLERRGYRVKRRRLYPSKVGKNHQITKEEAINFVKNLGVNVE